MSYKEERKKRYGEIILELREKSHMTQTQLSEKLNVNSNAISKWENGITLPSEENIIKLNKIFNVSIDDIYNSKINNNNKSFIYKTKKFIQDKFIIFISILSLILLFLIFLLTYFINNFGVFNYYNLESTNQNYTINGNIIKFPDKISINASNLYLYDSVIKSINYETTIYLDDIFIYKIGSIENIISNKEININDYLKNININLSDELIILSNIKDINGKNLVFKINYIDSENNIKTIELTYSIKKIFSNNKLFY